MYGSIVYLLARWGHYRRAQVSDELGDVELDSLFGPGADPGLLTVLVPSYREDLAVVRQTVLTAALQDYPNRRVVVLVDDPPSPSVAEHADALDGMRRLPALVQAQLGKPAARLGRAEQDFHARVGRHGHLGPDELAAEARRLAGLHESVAVWLDEQAHLEDVDDHTTRLFVQLTFVVRAASCRRRAAAQLAAARAGELTTAQMRQVHHRLSRMLCVEIRPFEQSSTPTCPTRPIRP